MQTIDLWSSIEKKADNIVTIDNSLYFSNKDLSTIEDLRLSRKRKSISPDLPPKISFSILGMFDVHKRAEHTY